MATIAQRDAIALLKADGLPTPKTPTFTATTLR